MLKAAYSQKSSITPSKFLSGLWLARVDNLNSNPGLWLPARNLEEKMDEKSDNVDIWINLFENKLRLQLGKDKLISLDFYYSTNPAENYTNPTFCD